LLPSNLDLQKGRDRFSKEHKKGQFRELAFFVRERVDSAICENEQLFCEPTAT
jgi:hypothetical protein